MSDSAPNTRTRKIGGIVAVLGAGLMVAMMWAPWVKFPDQSMSGWDIHEKASGSEQWFIGDFVAEFSPFFAPLSILAVAGVLGLLGLVLAMRAKPLGRGAQMGLMLIGIVGLFIAFADPIMISTTGPGADIVTFDWGLLALAAAGFVAFTGVLLAGATRGRKPTG